MPPARSASPTSGPTAAKPAVAPRRSSRPARSRWSCSSGALRAGGSPPPRTSPPDPPATRCRSMRWRRTPPRRSAKPWSSTTWASTLRPPPGRPSSSCAMLAGLWIRSRSRAGPAGSRRPARVNPLEAAGAILVLATFGMIFSARGTEAGFENLRGLGWYDAMAELGAVLFVSGWCAGSLPSPPPAAIEPPARRELLVVVLFAAVIPGVAGAPRRSRHLRVSWGIGAPRAGFAEDAHPPYGRRPRRSGPGPAASAGRARPHRAGGAPARDRPRSEPHGGGTDFHPGDASATPRPRPREVTRPSRASGGSRRGRGRPAMSRFRFTIARLVWVVALAAIISGAFLVDPMLGLALFVAAGLGLAVFFLREDLANVLNAMLNLLRRPVGRVTLILLFAGIVTAPAILFFDPATYAPNRRGHIARDPREFYTIYSDDVAYVAASRTWDRTRANLLVPHNTHIVPAWRLVTWGMVVCAGNLERLPVVLGVASYGILVAVMLMAGRLVARETGRIGSGPGDGGDGRDDLADVDPGGVVFRRPAIVGGLRHPGDALVCPVLPAERPMAQPRPRRARRGVGRRLLVGRPSGRSGGRRLPLARRPPPLPMGRRGAPGRDGRGDRPDALHGHAAHGQHGSASTGERSPRRSIPCRVPSSRPRRSRRT